MGIDSFGLDNNIQRVGMTPSISQPAVPKVGEGVKLDNSNAMSIGTDEKASSGTSKGKIPASGSLFATAETPSYQKNAESVIQQSSGDKKQLQSFLSALEKVDVSKGVESIDTDTLNELFSLGFDVSSDHGKLVIKDLDGNNIPLNDFPALKEKLSNTIQRTIGTAPVAKNEASTKVQSVGAVAQTATIQPQASSIMNEAQQQEMLAILKVGNEANVVATNTVQNKAQLENSLKEYDSMVTQAQKQSQKVDMSISQILALQSQANSIIEKSKNSSITDIEKQQLKSLVSTMEMKQKELRMNQDGSELLMKQLDSAFDKISPNLSASEKDTKDNLQAALKAKVSGQALTARQDFVSVIAEEAYKLTANMTEEQRNKVMADPNERMKLFAPMNKLMDKASGAKSLSEFSAQDISTLKEKFHIEVKEEQGQVVLYHTSKGKEPEKLTKDDLRVFKTDLNNFVKSPELFNVARAAGQISLAYSGSEPIATPTKAVNSEEVKQDNGEIKLLDKKAEKEIAKNDPPKTSHSGSSDNEVLTDKLKAQAKSYEVNSMFGAIARKEEEEKHHQGKLQEIVEKRHEVNRYLENKRNDAKNFTDDQQRRSVERKAQETIVSESLKAK